MAKKLSFNFLLSPWTVFASIIGGCVSGFKYPEVGASCAPFGEIFLALLQMCIIPILVTAVVSSIGKLISSGHMGNYIGKVVSIFGVGLLVASLTGISIGLIAKPGASLSEKARVTLGKLVAKSEMQSQEKAETQSPDLVDFFKKIIPSNVFDAFSRGQNLGILFFCILFGLSLGFVRSSSAETALAVAEALYDAFLKLIGWIMYILPLGLFCIFASEISKVGLEVLGALLRFVVIMYVSAIVLMLLCHCVIWWRMGGSFFKPLKALRETLVVALGTSSSFASIPSALRCLQNNLGIERGTANLVVPLGVNLNPQGSVLYFALSTIFIAQIYNVSLSCSALLITVIGSILIGMAATGMPGAGSLSMLALILGPLGLPSQAAVIFLIAIDPIIDPILTVCSIHANCTAAVLASSEVQKPSSETLLQETAIRA